MRPILAALLLTGSLSAGCGFPSQEDSATTAPPEQHVATAARTDPPSPEPQPKAYDRVIAVSVDGLNPDAIAVLGAGRNPTFHRLMREGSYTLNARTEYEATNTLPNHTGMFTGRRVASSSGGHGVVFNRDNGGTVDVAADDEVDSVFDVVHQAGMRTALFAGKPKFELFARSWPDGIDMFAVDADVNVLLDGAIRELRANDASFVFMHLALPDQAGHATGFMGPGYLDAVAEVDRLLGRLLDVLESDSALRRSSLLLVTADHGGRHGHRVPTDPENYVVPFFAWGPRVPASTDLYLLNPWFADPAASRAGYGKARQPIRNGHLANAVTNALGLGEVPESNLDQEHRLQVWRGSATLTR